MRPSNNLMQHTARITLFTRANCSLCDTAKSTISKLAAKRSFGVEQIDVMASDQKQWREMYEFDTPVVCMVSLCSFSSLCLSHLSKGL